MENKVLHQLKAKGNNKHIIIQIIEYTDKTHAILVVTKRLVDFKSRDILITNNLYSVETFALLKDMFNFILNKSEISNKLFLKELNNINKFKISTSL